MIKKAIKQDFPIEKVSPSYEEAISLDEILEPRLSCNGDMLKKEENQRDEIVETKTNLKITIEINNIDKGTIDLKRIKSSTDDREGTKINVKHEDGSLKLDIKKEN